MKTPQQQYPELAKAIGISELYLKREDLHSYGSHKGRSIPFMIKQYTKQGIRDFVISSSGNAALAALRAVQIHNTNNPQKGLSLKIFIGNHVDQHKLAVLKKEKNDANIFIEQVDRPKQSAFLLGKKEGVIFLRQSTDELALVGYNELAQELLKIPDLSAVFIPTSSGTTAQAVAETFLDTSILPQVNIVQTIACHPIAQEFIKPSEEISDSQAGAIVDHIAHRKQAVINTITQTNGTGLIPLEEEITQAIELIKTHTDITTITANGALGLAGLLHALKNKKIFDGAVCCVVTGR